MSSYLAYQCLGELGKGSYAVNVTSTGDIVAIKCFAADKKDYFHLKRSVMVEVTALREIVHENVVRLFHVFSENSRFYLVFELVDRTLLDVIRGTPKKCLGGGNRTRSYTYQLLRAVAFVHANNYVHRDVKPENVLINNDNVLKLADFGFTTKSSHAGQRYSTYIATRWYRAPELLTGDVFYGKGVDVWAVGAVIVEMVLGQPLAAGEEDSEQMSKTIELIGPLPHHMAARINRHQETYTDNELTNLRFKGLEELLKGQPSSLVDVIKLCLEPDPRYRTAAGTILRHDLFVHDHPEFIPEIMTRIRQSNATSSKSSAFAFQQFLRKRDLYCKVAREMLLDPNRSNPQSISRYRQLGLSEYAIHAMSEMIAQNGRMPPDFPSRSTDVYESQREESGDTASYSSNFHPGSNGAPMYASRSSGSGYRLIPPVQTRQPLIHPAFVSSLPNIHPLFHTAPTPARQVNPWNNFSIQKTFPTPNHATVLPDTTRKPLTHVSSRTSNMSAGERYVGSSRLSLLKDQFCSQYNSEERALQNTSRSDRKCDYRENSSRRGMKAKLPEIIPTFAQYMTPIDENVDGFGDGRCGHN